LKRKDSGKMEEIADFLFIDPYDMEMMLEEEEEENHPLSSQNTL
jgi:hypothetical protein